MAGQSSRRTCLIVSSTGELLAFLPNRQQTGSLSWVDTYPRTIAVSGQMLIPLTGQADRHQ